jgi:hypothetical protein
MHIKSELQCHVFPKILKTVAGVELGSFVPKADAMTTVPGRDCAGFAILINYWSPVLNYRYIKIKFPVT